ncbi:MAG: HEAT repeat domain-containing protein, partial [Candidatus Binatia bacterium]|nr:HEAT repeat domain-containing protein [Candidatus Binatia bacterium]
IRFIGQIGRPKSRRWLFASVSTEHHHSIRFHVLVALLRCLHDEALVVDEIGRLLRILEEQEYPDLMRLTLELLESHSLSEKFRPQLSRLLESPHPSVQKFALRKMGEFHTPGVARTLIEQLGDRDYTRRDAAAHSLQKMPEARSALMKEFLACDDASKAWSMAELLPSFEGKWRRNILDGVWKRLTKAVEDTDRIQRSYFQFLKSVAPDFVYTLLSSSGSRLKKAKKYREAIRYLSLLQELPAFKVEDKFLLAVSQLKIRSQAVQSAGRRQNPALELLSDLFRSSTFPLLEALKKEKSLEPEDMFYLGFTFAEGAAEERTLGRGLLEFLAQRHPRTKTGRNAKNKLKLLAA